MIFLCADAFDLFFDFVVRFYSTDYESQAIGLVFLDQGYLLLDWLFRGCWGLVVPECPNRRHWEQRLREI